MSVGERALRQQPPARGRLLERTALAIPQRALRDLEGGTLAVVLPNGSRRSFGTGPAVELTVHDMALIRRIATRGTIGFAESYQAGEWDTGDLPALFELLLRNAEAAARRHPRWRQFFDARPRPNTRKGRLRARRNIASHYALGNDLFELMLDETMTYSCAVFESPDDSLADAQRRKYRRICEHLRLAPSGGGLEIGCGWGGFARFAAEEYGCHVTGLSISAAQ